MSTRVLVINAFAPDDGDRGATETAVATLIAAGHEVECIDLVDSGFGAYLTAAERRAYHLEGQNILADEVGVSIAALRRAGAVLFCYPSQAFTVPAVLKGWMERCLVPGVAFGFDAKGRVVPGMTHIHRIGVVTATPHSRWQRARARDAGRRTILRSLRLNCSRRCRRTFAAVPAGSTTFERVRRPLARW